MKMYCCITQYSYSYWYS